MTGSPWLEGVDHAAYAAYTRPYSLESEENWQRCLASLDLPPLTTREASSQRPQGATSCP